MRYASCAKKELTAQVDPANCSWSPNYDLFVYANTITGFHVIRSSGEVVFQSNKKVTAVAWNPTRTGPLLAVAVVTDTGAQVDLYTVDSPSHSTVSDSKYIKASLVPFQIDGNRYTVLNWTKTDRANIITACGSNGGFDIWEVNSQVQICRLSCDRVVEAHLTSDLKCIQTLVSCLDQNRIPSIAWMTFDSTFIYQNIQDIQLVCSQIRIMENNLQSMKQQCKMLKTKWMHLFSSFQARLFAPLDTMLKGYDENANATDALITLLISGSASSGVQQFFSRSRAKKSMEELQKSISNIFIQILLSIQIQLVSTIESILLASSMISKYVDDEERFHFLSGTQKTQLNELDSLASDAWGRCNEMAGYVLQYRQNIDRFFQWIFINIARFSESDQIDSPGLESLDTDLLLRFIELMEDQQHITAVPDKLLAITSFLETIWKPIALIPLQNISTSILPEAQMMIAPESHSVKLHYNPKTNSPQFIIFKRDSTTVTIKSFYSPDKMIKVPHPLIDVEMRDDIRLIVLYKTLDGTVLSTHPCLNITIKTPASHLVNSTERDNLALISLSPPTLEAFIWEAIDEE